MHYTWSEKSASHVIGEQTQKQFSRMFECQVKFYGKQSWSSSQNKYFTGNQKLLNNLKVLPNNLILPFGTDFIGIHLANLV